MFILFFQSDSEVTTKLEAWLGSAAGIAHAPCGVRLCTTSA